MTLISAYKDIRVFVLVNSIIYIYIDPLNLPYLPIGLIDATDNDMEHNSVLEISVTVNVGVLTSETSYTMAGKIILNIFMISTYGNLATM